MTTQAFMPFGEADFHTDDLREARIVVLPVCYEKAVSCGSGTSLGPQHILQASEQLEALDEETLVAWPSLQVHTVPALFPHQIDPEQAVLQIKQAALEYLRQGKFLLSLGGDHAISIGTIQAAVECFPSLGVLQIDAHPDLRDEWNGSRYNHACVMRRVIEDMALPAVQVGLRAICTEELDFIRQNNLKPFWAHRLATNDERWIAQAIAALPDTVYITLDLDGLDPAVVPGVGTPEPGGLTFRQVVRLIQAVARQRRVIAADIVELMKIEGFQSSEYTAAKLATKIFVHCAAPPTPSS